MRWCVVDGGDFDGNQQTFPKLPRRAGYRTSIREDRDFLILT
jgi:hypothetical protein